MTEKRKAPAVFIDEELHCTGHKPRQQTLPPGTCHWEFYEKDHVDGTLNFVCPCGCGEVDFIFVNHTPRVQTPERCWQWDGNKEKPTLTPSISRVGAACKWHGYLTDGVFTEC